MRPTLLSAISLSVLLLVTARLAADEAPLPKLIQDLGSADQSVRDQALEALSELGPQAASAVPALIEALGHTDREHSWRAARALGAIGPQAEAAVPQLTKALKDEHPKVRAYAAYALGRIGKPAAIGASDALIENAFDKDPLVRRSTLRALRMLDPPQERTMPLVMRILEEGDVSIILPALQSLAEQGKDAVPRLREALKHEAAQYWACLALADIGPDAADAVPDLRAVLKARDPDVRLEALVALGQIGSASKPAIPEIAALVDKDEFKHVRYAAIYALGNIGTDAAAFESLQRAIASDDEFTRTISAWALARTNPGNKQMLDQAVRMILSAFESTDVHVRQAAARAIVEFDVDRQLVAPLLVKALEDKDPTVVANAIEALANLGPQALSHIDDALANPALRHYAVLLIARLGREGASAVPALVDALGKQTDSPEDIEFIREAHFALSAIGPEAKEAIPTLVKALASDKESVSASACYALGKMGGEARAAVPALQRAEMSENLIVRAASVFALWQIQPGNPIRRVKATGLLLKALEDDREMVRVGAVTMLGELGAADKVTQARLEQVRDNDEVEFVRRAAAEALKKLAG